jgi:hypothetical protein
MPDPLLFLLGLLVTVVVGLAVWSVGLMDVDDGTRRESDPRNSEGGR